MTDTQLILAGPALALLALLLFSIPSVRPRVLTRGIGWLGACMLLPMAISYLFQSSSLITLTLLLKPITAPISATLFLGYVVKWRSKRLPLITALPSFLLLCGSIADVLAVSRLGSSWGGASC